MHRDRDPVDGAIEALRNEDWTQDSINPKLEEKLMNEYRSQSPTNHSIRRRTLVALSAVLLIGGGTFAATGGVETIRQWLVQVEINGQVHEMLADENGVGIFTIDTEDGGQAEVQVEFADTPEEGESRTIRIQASSPAGEGIEDVEMLCKRQVRVAGQASPDQEYTIEDLGDTQPALTWEQDGTTQAVYILPNSEEEGEGFKVLLAATATDGETTVFLVAAPPVALPDDPDALNIDFDEDGMLTIRINADAGWETVMKLKVAAGEEDCPLDAPMKLNTPDGHIQITVQMQPENEQ